MTNKKDLPNNLKFSIYFIICVIMLFVILYVIILPRYLPIMILTLSTIIYPGILSLIEGILATIFYLENKMKKITRFSVLLIIIISIASTVYWSETLKEPLALDDILINIVFFSALSSAVYLIGTQGMSYFISMFKHKKIPKEPEIKNDILCYQYTGSHTPVVDTLRKINSRFFDYRIPKKPYNEDNSYEFTKIPGDDKYLLMFVDKRAYRHKDGTTFKRFFVLPLQLKDFLFFKIDKEKLTRMKNIYDEMLKYIFYKPLDDEYEAPISYLNEIAKPIQDRRMGLIREILNPKMIAFLIIAILGMAIWIYHETIINLLLSPGNTLLAMLIIGIIGIVVGGFMVGFYNKLKSSYLNWYSKK